MKCLPGRSGSLEIRPGVVAQTQIELASSDGLLHRVRVTLELGADRRSDEIGAIRINPSRTSRSMWPKSTYPILIVIFSLSGSRPVL